MKKNFAFSHPKLKIERIADSIKFEIKKYLNRERRKVLPVDADYWSFDCKFGPSEQEASVIFTSEINRQIDAAVNQQWSGCYVEILAKACKHQPKTSE